MIVEKNCGTLEKGRWVNRDNPLDCTISYIVWNERGGSHYNGIVLDPERCAPGTSTDRLPCAKEYVELLNNNKEEYLTINGTRLRLETFNAINNTFMLKDLKYSNISTMVREHIYTDKVIDVLASSLRGGNVLCSDPRCLFIRQSTESWFAGRCPSCGEKKIAQIDEYKCAGGTLPAHFAVAISQAPIETIMGWALLSGILNMAHDNECLKLISNGNRLSLALSSEHPSVKVGGNHFIRARTNRRVLENHGWGSPPQIGADMSCPLLTLYNPYPNMWPIMNLYLVLENPDINLMPSISAEYRQDIIKEAWEKEYVDFVKGIKDRGLLITDSAGLKDTLGVLYNVTIRKIDKRPVIKKDGSIVFPTADVISSIDRRAIESAFRCTEHPTHDSIESVFSMEAL